MSQLESRLRSFSPMTATRTPEAVWLGTFYFPSHSQRTPGKHLSQWLLPSLPKTLPWLPWCSGRIFNLGLPRSGPAHLCSLNWGHFLQISYWVSVHSLHPQAIECAPHFASRPQVFSNRLMGRPFLTPGTSSVLPAPTEPHSLAASHWELLVLTWSSQERCFLQRKGPCLPFTVPRVWGS